MSMISVRDILGNQYSKARERVHIPVVAVDSCTYRVQSATRDELDHKVQLDDSLHPGTCSCTCEAGQMGKGCWAMARVLIALEYLRAGNIRVARGAASAREGLDWSASALVLPAEATFDEDGALRLKWSGQPPEAELLYSISN